MSRRSRRHGLVFAVPVPGKRGRRGAAVALAAGLWLLAAALPGCAGSGAKADPPAPRATFSGPEYLYGTVGSLTTLRGAEPLMVSGYGLVVGLRGTGSAECPAFLRNQLINRMRRLGVGSPSVPEKYLAMLGSPEQLLASLDTAVVRVDGFIPPAAVPGTAFDLLVTALPQTQTTSLEGGVLFTTELSVGGHNISGAYSRTLAHGHGWTYLRPLAPEVSGKQRLEIQRQAVIIGGGVAQEPRPIDLELNTPSATRANQIESRIRERFGREPGERQHTAVAKSESRVSLHIPRRYAHRPGELLDLIMHLDVRRGPDLEQERAAALAEVLVADASTAPRVMRAWEALGRTALGTINKYYDHANPVVRLAALRTGARLGDLGATRGLLAMAKDADPARRREAAAGLVLLHESLPALAAVRQLLSDEDRSVRLATYNCMVDVGHPGMFREYVGGRGEHFRFILDLVPSSKPMIYVKQADFPYLVVFGPDLGFQAPFLARALDERLLIRAQEKDKPLEVFYQFPGRLEMSKTLVAPAVPNLALLLGHRANDLNPTQGLHLTYGEVVGALHVLHRGKHVEADWEMEMSPLAKLVEAHTGGTEDLRPHLPSSPDPSAATQPAGSLFPVAPVAGGQ